MHRGLMDRVLVALVGVAIIAGAPFARSAKGAPTSVPGGWRIVSSPALPGGELIGVSALGPGEAWAVGSQAVGGVLLTSLTTFLRSARPTVLWVRC